MGTSRDKYRVTVKWYEKIIVTFLLLLITVSVVAPLGDDNVAPTLAMLVYSLLFVYLAVNGTNNKISRWIAERKLFMYVFMMPTIVCAFYSGGYFIMSVNASDAYLSAFAALLTILSIPFALILLRFQGGIRRKNALYAFLAFPVLIFLVCKFFVDISIMVATGAAVIVFVICFITALIQYDKDHKADYASGDDKSESGSYTANWDGHPLSDVHNNVIHLKGTIVVKYYGDYYDSDKANSLAHDLINSYVRRVHSDMKGYSVDSASVTIRSQKMD